MLHARVILLHCLGIWWKRGHTYGFFVALLSKYHDADQTDRLCLDATQGTAVLCDRDLQCSSLSCLWTMVVARSATVKCIVSQLEFVCHNKYMRKSTLPDS